MVLSIICICVVFTSLLILYGCYTLIGIICTRVDKKAATAPSEAEDTVGAVSSEPVSEPEDKEPHDKESYIITIERASTMVAASASSRHKSVSGSAVRGFSDSDAADVQITGSGKSSGNGTVNSPLPGVILDVKVKVGDKVAAGSTLAVLEAMKMENAIEATKSGIVAAVHVSKGQSVLEGEPIVSIS